MRSLPVLVLAVAALGCIDREEAYTLNPDGSGKVLVRWVGAPFSLMDNTERDPEKLVRTLVRAELTSAQGIDCWKDVTWSLRPDGKIAFQGTAYFKSLNDLDLKAHGLSRERFTMDKDPAGNLVLQSTSRSGNEDPPSEKPDAETLKRDMARLRMKYQQARPAYRALLGDYRCRLAFTLPGAVGETRGFVKGDRTLAFELKGEALMKAFDALYLDDEALTKAVTSGERLEIQEDSLPVAVVEAALGSKDFKSVTQGALTPVFDYDAEVTADVRTTYGKLIESLPEAAGVGMGGRIAPATPPTTEHASLDAFLRDQLTLDLSAPVGLRSAKPGAEYQNLMDGLQGLEQSYVFEGPNFSMSGGGDFDSRIAVRFGDDHAVRRFEFTSGPDTVAITQKGTTLKISVENEVQGMTCMGFRTARGFHLAVLEDGRLRTQSWPTPDDAATSDPSAIEFLLSALRKAPVRLAPTPATTEVMAVALRWHEEIDAATREKFDALRQRLLSESIEARDAATTELKTAVGSDFASLRYVVAGLEEMKGEADACARLRMILESDPTFGPAVVYVGDKGLHRHLGYLGALLASPAHQTAARTRLERIIGRTFQTRAELDGWHAGVKDKLVWDAKAGKYSVK